MAPGAPPRRRGDAVGRVALAVVLGPSNLLQLQIPRCDQATQSIAPCGG